MARPDDFAPVAITDRNGVDESVHFGAVVGMHRDGSVALSVGNPDALVFPRSSNKPMQAVAMWRAGLRVPAELLAIACASHDGTPRHQAAARALLSQAGLAEDALGNTASLPLDEEAAWEVLRSGGGPTRLAMNCSGKHAAMLATCRHRRWDLDGYLDPGHPLQEQITGTITELTGEQPSAVGVDGCGAPAHAFSLTGLARAFGAIASGAAQDVAEVSAAMRSFPELVGGERRDVTVLMRALPGLTAKDGAEGVLAAALADGRSVAVKVADGGPRACAPVMVAALAALGCRADDLLERVTTPMYGHGEPVGRVRAIAP